MAITYTGSSGVFTHLGKIVARVRSYDAVAGTTLAADLATLLTAFGTTWYPVEGIAHAYQQLQDTVSGWKRTVASYGDARLLDPATVLTQLSAPLGSASIDTLVPALARQMTIDGQTVKSCSCTVGAVVAATGNTGDGSAYPTLVLDGYSSPLVGGRASPANLGRRSQLCVPSETMTMECTADSATGGRAVGGESWSWSGSPRYQAYDWRAEGSGDGPGVVTDGGQNALQGGYFSGWSGNVPSGWAIDSGTAGTHVLRETIAGNLFAGTGAAILAGDGSTTITLGQAPSTYALVAGRRYRVGVALRATGCTSGTLTVGFAGGTEAVSLACTSLGLSYALYGVHTTLPVPLPLPFRFTVSVAGLNAGGRVWVGGCTLAPTAYHGGVGVNVAAGNTPWRKGDRLTFTVTNNEAGKFQSHFRRFYRTMLPSVLSGTPVGYALTLPFLLMTSTPAETIADSLVA